LLSTLPTTQQGHHHLVYYLCTTYNHSLFQPQLLKIHCHDQPELHLPSLTYSLAFLSPTDMSTDDSTPTLTWSASLTIAKSHIKLPADKIILPPSALEQLLAAAPVTESLPTRSGPLTSNFDPFNPYTYAAERSAREWATEKTQTLPHPLTFRLVNPENGRVVYAGIREFSADEGTLVLSQWLHDALDVKEGQDDDVAVDDTASEQGGSDDDAVIANGADHVVPKLKGPNITVHARQLPKGTFVKLRPLESGYDAEDWKALLEQYLRTNFTTLTNGEVLTVPGGRGIGSSSDSFKFLIDGFKPEGDGICIVDTDLEVDIEALNEEQARETLKKISEKALLAPGTANGSSAGGRIDLFQSSIGQVLPGEWVDYTLPAWDRAQGIDIELSGVDDDAVVNLYVSPLAPRQRVQPREDEYIFAELDGRYPKRIRISPTNSELENAESIQIAVHAFSDSIIDGIQHAIPFTISVNPFDPATTMKDVTQSSETPPNPDEARCKNCHQWIPHRTMMLHANFCYRNNSFCPKGCEQVFQKRSPEWENHWHCPHDSSWGSSAASKSNHDHHFHTSAKCSSCERTYASHAALAQHRTSICPGKLILCQFCHLQVPQEGDPDALPDAEVVLSGLTPHELADGARTTDCHLCGRFIRLRDMGTHLKHHELQKRDRPAPIPCRNVLCGRSVHGTGKNGDTRMSATTNSLGLCGRCFGPLYVAVHDPDGRALKRRVERRYLTQLLTGCGRAWCRNEFCRTGRKNSGLPEQGTSTREALPMVKPELEGLGGDTSPLHFCADEMTQQSRILAEQMAAEERYGFDWCLGALEASAGDVNSAREWMTNWALKKG